MNKAACASIIEFRSAKTEKSSALVDEFHSALRLADQSLMDASVALREIEAQSESMNMFDLGDIAMLLSLYMERAGVVTGNFARAHDRLLAARNSEDDYNDSL